MEKREILFRGWNKKNKQWLYGYYCVNRGEHFIAPDEFVNPLASYEDYIVDADTVGQYTGLKDAKGTKIFEGDILNVDFLDTTRIVSYCKDGFVCGAANMVSYDLHNVYKDCRVITNLHDYQELQLKLNDMKRKELEKRYNNIANIKCYDCRDEVHGYVCEVCHKEVFTTCADKGVTPFCISCECGGTMTHLKTYRKSTFPKDIKVFEFRRPSFKKMLKGGESMIQHVLNGGLVLDKTK